MDFSKKLLIDKYNPEIEQFNNFEDFLFKMFAEFIENLKTKDEFSPYKHDYFPI